MLEEAAQAQKPTLIARIAGVLLVLFSASMWYGIFLFLAVVPAKMEPAYQKFQMGRALPASIKFLFGASSVITTYWYLFALVVAAVVAWLIWLALRRDRLGRLLLLAGVSFVSSYAAALVVCAATLWPLLRMIKMVGAD